MRVLKLGVVDTSREFLIYFISYLFNNLIYNQLIESSVKNIKLYTSFTSEYNYVFFFFIGIILYIQVYLPIIVATNIELFHFPVLFLNIYYYGAVNKFSFLYLYIYIHIMEYILYYNLLYLRKILCIKAYIAYCSKIWEYHYTNYYSFTDKDRYTYNMQYIMQSCKSVLGFEQLYNILFMNNIIKRGVDNFKCQTDLFSKYTFTLV